jgi:hypothetical protein
VIYAFFIGSLLLLATTSPEAVSVLVTALLTSPELMASTDAWRAVITWVNPTTD